MLINDPNESNKMGELNALVSTEWKIPPILQLHIKRTWISGLAIDQQSLAKEVSKIDPRVDPKEVLSFLQAHVETPDWIAGREEALNRAYAKMQKDSEQVRELIDQRYDKNFQQIQLICAEQIDHIATMDPKDRNGKPINTLRTITNILKDTYLMQRLARGMSQGKHTIEVLEENSQFSETLKKLQERLDEKIIEAQVKVLPSL